MDQKQSGPWGSNPEARKTSLADEQCSLPKTPETASPIKKKRADATVEAVIALLAEKWPATFSTHEGRRRPLKIGIHLDVMAAIGGAVTRTELSRALACYTANLIYLAKLRTGARRIGLDGESSGTVTVEQANYAKILRSMSVQRRSG